MAWSERYGGDPEDYVGAHYREFGYSSVSVAKAALNMYLTESEVNRKEQEQRNQERQSGARETWRNRSGLSNSDFAKLILDVGTKVAQNNAEDAASAIDANWKRMSAEQQRRIQAWLEEHGVRYLPGRS